MLWTEREPQSQSLGRRVSQPRVLVLPAATRSPEPKPAAPEEPPGKEVLHTLSTRRKGKDWQNHLVKLHQPPKEETIYGRLRKQVAERDRLLWEKEWKARPPPRRPRTKKQKNMAWDYDGSSVAIRERVLDHDPVKVIVKVMDSEPRGKKSAPLLPLLPQLQPRCRPL
jgi:hypothetical protein